MPHLNPDILPFWYSLPRLSWKKDHYTGVVAVVYRAVGPELNFMTAINWLSSRVLSMLDLGAEGPEFKSQP